jgi:hypothetical protein
VITLIWIVTLINSHKSFYFVKIIVVRVLVVVTLTPPPRLDFSLRSGMTEREKLVKLIKIYYHKKPPYGGFFLPILLLWCIIIVSCMTGG